MDTTGSEKIATRSCLSCRSAETFPIIFVDERGIPPGEEGHAITYSQTIIALCRSCGSGQVEEFSHDCFDFEEVFNQYTWYVLSPADAAELRSVVEACPTPLTAKCTCPVHTKLRSGCSMLPSTHWSEAFEPDELHTRKISLGDILR
jgi:hypothetical protein